jgi:VanZ family protein
MKENIKWYYSPKSQIILYALLLVFTPFLMLQNYLQTAIGTASRFSFYIGKLEIPYILVIVIVFVVFSLVLLRPRFTRFRIIAGFAVILLIILGQHSTDYYFSHRFYDLQHNWHYLAYGLYSYLAYRLLKFKGKPAERIILYTFISALALSTFDEGIQVFISNRIFDICDIAKDVWGTTVGIIFIFFILEKGKIIRNGWKIRQPRISGYLKNPFSILFLEIIFAYILLLVSSVLTDIIFLKLAVVITLGIFIVFFLILHFSQYKIPRIIFISLGIIILLVQGIFFFKYRKDNIVYNTYGLTVYKGIPIPLFDIMIYPDGTFRLVDKKHNFNKRDILTIYDNVSNILLIGSGTEGKGGQGFPENSEFQFVFHNNTRRGLQVIVLKTPEACKEFNRLKKEGYNVLFIIHNTC